MMNYTLLYQMETMVAAHFSSLNSWQQQNVALFAYGVIATENCQQGKLARAVSCGEAVESTARRWRRWLNNPAIDHGRFFAELTAWVSQNLPTDTVTLLVDETKLHDRIGIMAVGVAWEGRCLILAWRCYEANCGQAYPPEGQVEVIRQLLEQVKAGLKPSARVLVLADRGIGCSPALCRVVEALQWQYLFRVTCQTKLVTDEEEYTIAQQVQEGEIWAASGRAFKQRGRVPAHARALWGVGHAEPWALVTNDERLTGHEYALRNWQEQSFRDFKSGGWCLDQSRIRLPGHVTNLLMILALTHAWLIALGSQAVAAGLGQALIRCADGTLRRSWSLFREGLRFFAQVARRRTLCPDLLFIPDTRCRWT